jgi:S-adenosylmethionine-diacylglycerol 3-amino-3-carboxypropyl transferase
MRTRSALPTAPSRRPAAHSLNDLDFSDSPVLSPPSTAVPEGDAVRYGQCWEDADVLISGLRVHPGDTVLSIASAGDNALALLTRSPERVVAVDVSGAQLACLALRVAAYRCLDHQGLLELVGSEPSDRRAELYAACRPHLDDATRHFWDTRPETIKRGIGAAGRFERYLRIFRTVILPLCHGSSRVNELLRPKPESERREFFDTTWNSLRWRALLRLFCSRAVMSRLGRDPAFFEQVSGPVSRRLVSRIERVLTDLNPAANPYLQWILTGQHQTARPLALREQHFETIRSRLDRLSWHQVSLEDYLAAQPSRSIDRFNLSNVFEYVDADHHRSLMSEVARVGRGGGRVAYWNLLVDRSRPSALSDRLRPCLNEAEALHRQDKAFFYSRFVLEDIAERRRRAPRPSRPSPRPMQRR